MKNRFYFWIILLSIFCWNKSIAGTDVQDNPVIAEETDTPPIIDGNSNDACWANAKWQSIDQTWYPYGTTVSAADFTGRFKVAWSSVTNRLYFLVEITDDVLVKGYQFPNDGWWNYDCVELFLDENHSGGNHEFNNNAFAYHITAGNNVKAFQAIDVDSNQKPVDYSSHMNVVIKNTGTVYTWEIELKVFDANLNEVTLTPNKVSGLALSYCDNDEPNENPKTRDNFFGSVAVDSAHWNDFHINASLFGTLKLTASSSKINDINADEKMLKVMSNAKSGTINIDYNSPENGSINIILYDTSGKIVLNETIEKPQATLKKEISIKNFTSGIYILELQNGQSHLQRKIYVTNH